MERFYQKGLRFGLIWLSLLSHSMTSEKWKKMKKSNAFAKNQYVTCY